jgi:hypothetical protein
LLDLPINVAMRDQGMSNIAGDTLEAISTFLVEGGEPHAELKPASDASQRMDGLPLNGTKGESWDVVSKAETEASCSLATADGSPTLPLAGQTDVIYFEGSLPLVLAIPLGGCEGTEAGSDAAEMLWAGFNTIASESMESDSGTIALGEAIRERCRLTVGALPHIVVVNLHPSKVCVTKPLREATDCVRNPAAAEPSDADLLRQSQLRERAECAWKNYHTLIECARKRIATGEGAAARAGAGMLLELTSSGAKGWMHGIAHLSYGLSTFAVQRVRGDTGGMVQSNEGAEDEAIAEAFAMFDVDGSGEIDRDELSSVAKELGVPLSESDLDDAMKQMDADGSGEVDLQEFAGWYKSLTSSNSGAPSKLELIKLNSMLSSSSIPALGRRQNWSPTQAVFGPGAPGSLLCAYGALALPSDVHPDPVEVETEASYVPR